MSTNDSSIAIQKTWVVKFYQTKRGDYPVNDFLTDQDNEISTKVFSYFSLLQNNGPFLKPPQIKKLQSNLYELRIKSKLNIRAFYTIFNNEYYILHIFKKKTQKTPTKELKIAIDRMNSII
jgi:phage-related protein